jgi:nitrogen fixation protein FixH
MSMVHTEKPVRPFTGRHMLAILITFFSVVIGVNLLMAYFANSTWSGLVVANGYVASQSFDKDLAKSRAQLALGWTVTLAHEPARVAVTFRDKAGVPIDGLAVTAELERTVTDAEDQKLTLQPEGGGVYSAPAKVAPGVWELEFTASGAGAADPYRKIIRFYAKN